MATSGMLATTSISPAPASAAASDDYARVTNWCRGLYVQVGKRSPFTWRGIIGAGPVRLGGEEHFRVDPLDGGVPGWFSKDQLTADPDASASTLPSEENLDSDGEGNEGDDDEGFPQKDPSTPGNDNTGHGSGPFGHDILDLDFWNDFPDDFDFSGSARDGLTGITDLLEEIFGSDDFAHHIDQCAAQVLGEMKVGIKVVDSEQPAVTAEETEPAVATLLCTTHQHVPTLDEDKHDVAYGDLGTLEAVEAAEHSDGEDTATSNVTTTSSATDEHESDTDKIGDYLVPQILTVLDHKDKEITYLRVCLALHS